MAVLSCFVAVLERCFESVGERFWDCFWSCSTLLWVVLLGAVVGLFWGCFGLFGGWFEIVLGLF